MPMTPEESEDLEDGEFFQMILQLDNNELREYLDYYEEKVLKDPDTTPEDAAGIFEIRGFIDQMWEEVEKDEEGREH